MYPSDTGAPFGNNLFWSALQLNLKQFVSFFDILNYARFIILIKDNLMMVQAEWLILLLVFGAVPWMSPLPPGPLLLTSIDFNLSMDKLSQPL